MPSEDYHRSPRARSRAELPGISASRTDDVAGDAVTGDSIDVQERAHTIGDSDEPPIEQQPPPAFGSNIGQVGFNQDGFGTNAEVSNDGRLNINIEQQSGQLSSLLAPALQSQLHTQESQTPSIHPSLARPSGQNRPPPLNVVIHVVGSRGDVQPFVALGKVLKESHGHRVRLATHATFKGFVEGNGLDFFAIGGDPAELMAFMVKNPGLMPGMETLRSGDVGRRRKGMYEIMQGCWRSCIEDGDGTAVRKNDSIIGRPFVADAIIANPPSFAHIHCAEKLGIPLHLMFTMPWSPTQAFPHPLANIQSNADASTSNFVSYALVEMMTWQGLGDIINRFRRKSLNLEPVSIMWAPGMLTRLQIPYTYCWSPALIPKPKDWGSHIDISGFYFLSLASAFTPASDLQEFLDAGEPPVYIGFGSIVVDDPDGMTNLIFEAVKKSGQRALVSKGWGGFGAGQVPDGVFMLGNVPHDWLFKRVSCVVHHGGAGTTAAGIALGKPTVVVPFFGDQPFWGAMVAKAGAGPPPIPSKELTADKLAAGILECLKPSTVERALELGGKIASEQGTQVGAESFHDRLDTESLKCAISDRAAVWRVKRTRTKLSAFAVATLVDEGLLDFNDIKLYRSKEYEVDGGPWDPISGILAELMGTTGSLMMGVSDLPKGTIRALHFKSTEDGKKDQVANSVQQASQPSNTSTSSLKPEEGPLVPSNTAKSLAHQLGTSGTQATMGAGKGIGKIMEVGLKSPMTFTFGLAKGFRNAPKLYGDDTVRQPDKITGLQSGFKAVGKEFGLGLYDGITGLVTQPIRGAKKEGFVGAMKGVGKGIGGVILKPSAAACGVPGYAFKGIYQEMKKSRGSSVQTYIIAARTAQGHEDWNNSTVEERGAVVDRWRAMKVELKKAKHKPSHESLHRESSSSLQTRSTSFDERMSMSGEESIEKKAVQGSRSSQLPKEFHELSARDSQASRPINSNNHEDTGSSEAVQQPKGIAREEETTEKAIRALVTQLQKTSTDGKDPEALERAIKASVAEITRERVPAHSSQSNVHPDTIRQATPELDSKLQPSRTQDHTAIKSIKRKPVTSIQKEG